MDRPQELGVLARNIGALVEARARFEQQRKLHHRAADAVTRFIGSVWSVLAHALFYGTWVVLGGNLVALVSIASVEAIFLTTFVLVNQNRMAELAERRADLDLQINLLAEREITRLLDLTVAIASRLDVEVPNREEVDELRKEVEPSDVLIELEVAHSVR